MCYCSLLLRAKLPASQIPDPYLLILDYSVPYRFSCMQSSRMIFPHYDQVSVTLTNKCTNSDFLT